MPPQPTPAPAAEPAPAAPAGTSFILVVEDDPILKNLLGHTFAGKYQTLYASDGTQAIALLEQNKPKLVLLDLVLPGMSGFDILQAIRARTDDLKSVPVLIVSNLGQQKDKERGQQLGANGYLVKAESSVDEIVAKIEQMLAPAG
ncbi:MAG TPA: response regulator [Candidatus Paceibacterota bacterium]